jgi:hypothetical protein
VLEKPYSWCYQQVDSCKTKVVASKGVGAHKNDNVQKIKTTYHIKKKRFSLYGFPQEIFVSVYFMCVIDVEYSISYFLALF